MAMGEPAKKNESTAIAKSEGNAITGTFHNAEAINARLALAQETYHLVSPFSAAGCLPEGCGIQIALVQANIANETYDVGGKRGLSKSALDRIAHGVGLSWDPNGSRRLDDGSDPHYCHFRAVGHYRAIDGQRQTVIGEKEVDLRDGSPQIEALWDRFRAADAKFKAGRQKYAPKDPAAQIREMRLHILGHAETKARLRAVRSMGLRSSYTADELAKPFACARIVFTGRSKDPELAREFSKMTAASFLGGMHSLYGEQSAPRALPASSGHAPPPVGNADDEDFIEAPVEAEPAAAPARAAESQTSKPERARGSGVIRFGRDKDTPIEEASDETLTWYASALRKSISDPEKARFKRENEADLAAVEHELARRRGEDAEPPEDDENEAWGMGEFPGDADR
jgi:hypothetical protein